MQLAVIYFEALDLELSCFFLEAAKKKSNVRVWFSFGVCHLLPGHAAPRLKASTSAHWHTLGNKRNPVQVISLSTTEPQKEK